MDLGAALDLSLKLGVLPAVCWFLLKWAYSAYQNQQKSIDLLASDLQKTNKFVMETLIELVSESNELRRKEIDALEAAQETQNKNTAAHERSTLAHQGQTAILRDVFLELAKQPCLAPSLSDVQNRHEDGGKETDSNMFGHEPVPAPKEG